MRARAAGSQHSTARLHTHTHARPPLATRRPPLPPPPPTKPFHPPLSSRAHTTQYRLTLLLAPPGSGKSTFLKTLSRDLAGVSSLKVCGGRPSSSVLEGGGTGALLVSLPRASPTPPRPALHPNPLNKQPPLPLDTTTTTTTRHTPLLKKTQTQTHTKKTNQGLRRRALQWRECRRPPLRAQAQRRVRHAARPPPAAADGRAGACACAWAVCVVCACAGERGCKLMTPLRFCKPTASADDQPPSHATRTPTHTKNRRCSLRSSACCRRAAPPPG